MKHWINTHYKTLIIAAFLIPIITVAIVSISHVTQWYGISNPVSWAVYLSIGIEIAALSALAAISANMGKKVYFPFAIVTLVQFIGNIFFAYSFIDIDSKSFKDWVDLVAPLVEFIGVESGDLVGHKRFLALFAGGMLPIISLSFLHMLVKFTEEDRDKEVKVFEEEQRHVIDDKLIQEAIEKYKKEQEESKPEELKDFVDETVRLKLSDEDLKKLEEVLLNPPPPNEKLKEAAQRYQELITQEPKGEIVVEEPKEEIIIEEPKIEEVIEEPTPTPIEVVNETPTSVVETEMEIKQVVFEPVQEEVEYIPTPEEEIQNQEQIIPFDEAVDNVSEMDEIYLGESIDEFNEQSLEDEFDGFVPEPFATPEEVEMYNIDGTQTPVVEPENVDVIIDEVEFKPFEVGVKVEENLPIENPPVESIDDLAEKKNL